MESEIDIKKQLQFIKQLQFLLTEGQLNHKYIPQVFEMFTAPTHRLIKMNLHSLIKTLPEEEIAQLKPYIEQDLKTNDPEILLSSLRLINTLPISSIIELFQTISNQLTTLLEAKTQAETEFHYERVEAIHSLLQYFQSVQTIIDPSDYPADTILTLYKRIVENSLSINRDVSANCIQCIVDLFQRQSTIVCPYNLTRVNQDDIINMIVNYYSERYQIMLEKIFSYEVRLRSKMVYLIAFVLRHNLQKFSHSTNKIWMQNAKDFVRYKLYYEILYNSFELDNISLVFQSISIILPYTKDWDILWKVFCSVLQFLNHVGYRKELDPTILKLALYSKYINPTTKIAMSMKILELSTHTVQNQVFRVAMTIVCFTNLIKSSMYMLTQGQQSSILGLFSQSWFLNKIKHDPELSEDGQRQQTVIREELLSCIVISVLEYVPLKIEAEHYKNTILVEVLDVAIRILEAKNIDPTDTEKLTIKQNIINLFTEYSQTLDIQCKNQLSKIMTRNITDLDVPIVNLRHVYTTLEGRDLDINIFSALEKQGQLISGLADFLQIYCNHVVDISNSQLCIGVRCHNISPFNLEKIEIKLLFDIDCQLVGQNNRIIEELTSYRHKSVFYVIKLEKLTELQFAFDICLQNVKNESGVFTIRSQNYTVRLLNDFTQDIYTQIVQKSVGLVRTNP